MQDINVYFIRHGLTYFNLYRKMQGWSDTPLLPESVAAATVLGQGFKDIDVSAIYMSDSGRVQQTRDAFLEGYQKAIPCTVDSRLREFHFGYAEGDSVVDYWNAVAANFGYTDFARIKTELPFLQRMDLVHQFRDNTMAETLPEFRERVDSAFQQIITDARERGYHEVVVISHGCTTIQLLALCGVEDNFLESPRNLSVSKVVVCEEGIFPEYVDDISRLEPIL